MKNKMKSAFMVALMGTGLFFTSCSNNDSITPTDDVIAHNDGKLVMTQEAGDTNLTIYTKDVTSDVITAVVSISSTTKDMQRIYITENIAGSGEHPYVFPAEVGKLNLKADGSLDIDPDAKFTSFVLPIKKLTSMTAGTVVYKIWATDGKGDFRDATNSFLVGFGTITINYGGTNPAATGVKNFSATMLAAPLANGTSKTFLSTLNGTTYDFAKVDGVAPDTAKLWDLGYYYGGTQKASLASAFNYPTDIVNISTVSGIPAAELNKGYFKASSKTSADFDAATAADLTSLSVTTASAQRITDLSTGDIVEFIDAYGKKGLIRVVEVKGTYNSGDYIKIEVKVQP